MGRVRPTGVPANARRKPDPSSAREGPDFRALFESAPGLFLVLDPDLHIVAVSDAYAAATMTVREEIVGRGIFEVFPDNPDDPGATGERNLRASLDRVRSRRVADSMALQKYDIRRPESAGGEFEIRYWSPVNSPVLDASGALRYIIHRVEDVTDFVRARDAEAVERRAATRLRTRGEAMEAEIVRRTEEIAGANAALHEANARLAESERFLGSILEHLPSIVTVKDARELRYQRLNRAATEIMGVTPDQVVGRSVEELFPGDEGEARTARDQAAVDARRVVVSEERVPRADGSTTILEVKRIPILDDAGEPVFVVAMGEDITHRKLQEEELRAARAAAEQANRAKNEFLSRMSHELRTPLNAILGFAQLLDMDDLTEEQRDHLRFITRGGLHLLDLINEVLDISRIESGQLALSPEPVEVAEVLAELLSMLRPLADGHRVRVEAGADLAGAHVLADRQRLKQVLLNLLANAIKYNRPGGRVSVEGRAAARGRFRISVTDTGFGIPKDQMRRLFQPFERLGAEHGPEEGTGMGLALSKGLVAALGGRIGVTSVVDTGSTFWVELQRATGQVAEPESRPDVTVASARTDRSVRTILHIEDNVSNRRLIEEIVSRREGTLLLAAASGEAGIELARAHQPALILLDLHLPDVPGREVLRRLRRFPETRHIPILVISADATPGLEKRLLADGAAALLTKPLSIATFLQTFDRLLGGGADD